MVEADSSPFHFLFTTISGVFFFWVWINSSLKTLSSESAVVNFLGNSIDPPTAKVGGNGTNFSQHKLEQFLEHFLVRSQLYLGVPNVSDIFLVASQPAHGGHLKCCRSCLGFWGPRRWLPAPWPCRSSMSHIVYPSPFLLGSLCMMVLCPHLPHP